MVRFIVMAECGGLHVKTLFEKGACKKKRSGIDRDGSETRGGRTEGNQNEFNVCMKPSKKKMNRRNTKMLRKSTCFLLLLLEGLCSASVNKVKIVQGYFHICVFYSLHMFK